MRLEKLEGAHAAADIGAESVICAESFVARTSVRRGLSFVLGSLGLVLTGFWLVGAFGPAPDPDKTWAGWSSILFFGICAIGWTGRLLDPKNQIVIDDRGILYRPWSDAFIPWNAIAGIKPVDIQGQQFLYLGLLNTAQHRSTRLLARLSGTNRILSKDEVSISMIGMNHTFAELVNAVDGHGARARAL